MNLKKTLRLAVASLTVLALVPIHAAAQSSYTLVLPKVAASPSLPYNGVADHHSGAASVQMALNACPVVAQRKYHSVATIHSTIQLYNGASEPQGLPHGWFSDPGGIRGALEDPALKGCGHWVDFSDTDKLKVLGNVLYYMDTFNYLTPVSIGKSESWVVVYGFETAAKPSPGAPIDLSKTKIHYYEPASPAGSGGYGIISGTTWIQATWAGYWGNPLSKPGSAWDGKYIAVIEPPRETVEVFAPEWVRDGPILEAEEIHHFARAWLEAEKASAASALADQGGGLGRGLFELLAEVEPGSMPLRVDAGEYSYYLVPFADPRLMAVFNAYDGSFEELRTSAEPRQTVLDPWEAAAMLEEALHLSEMEILDRSEPELTHRPELGSAGRTVPAWELEARIRDTSGNVRSARLDLDVRGEVLTDLANLDREGAARDTVGELRARLSYDGHQVYDEYFLLGREEIMLVSGEEALQHFAAAGYQRGGSQTIDHVLEYLSAPDAFAVLLLEREEGGLLYVPIPDQLADASCPAAFFLPLRFAGGGMVAAEVRECQRGNFQHPDVPACRCIGYRTEICDTHCIACDSAGLGDFPTIRELVLEQCGLAELCDPELFLDATPVVELIPGMAL